MLNTKFSGNRSTGSGEEDIEGFYHICAWLPSWSRDQYDFIFFYFLIPKSLYIKFG